MPRLEYSTRTELVPGGNLIKLSSYHYSDSYYKTKMIWRPSHVCNRNPYTRKDGLYIETGPWLLCSVCLLTIWAGTHDDIINWKHFPCYWPFVWGIHRSSVTRSFDVFFDLRLDHALSKPSSPVNNREADDLRRHGVHYDITVVVSHLFGDAYQWRTWRRNGTEVISALLVICVGNQHYIHG